MHEHSGDCVAASSAAVRCQAAVALVAARPFYSKIGKTMRAAMSMQATQSSPQAAHIRPIYGMFTIFRDGVERCAFPARTLARRIPVRHVHILTTARAPHAHAQFPQITGGSHRPLPPLLPPAPQPAALIFGCHAGGGGTLAGAAHQWRCMAEPLRARMVTERAAETESARGRAHG